MQTNVGIDRIGFYVPATYLEMDTLAAARGVDPAKFHIGLGQDRMALPARGETIVDMAVKAAEDILTPSDLTTIDTVIVATESSLDESKAAAVEVHQRLGIQAFARSFEIKEACYGATAGLTFARNAILQHPEHKILVIATDIAKYGLNTPGEPTQGAGAVAMLIAAEPRILTLSDETVTLTQDIDDFYRPTGQSYPTVDGKLSNQTYIDSFATVWGEYSRRYGKTFEDLAALIFHIPYTKMGKKALQPLTDSAPLFERYEKSTIYNRQVGNLYTASLYLSLASLLENSETLRAGDRIGLFSYGSGAVSELFAGELVDGYTQQLRKIEHSVMLENRRALTMTEYEENY